MARSLPPSGGQRDPKGGALPDRAPDRDGPTVGFDDGLDDGQAQASAAVLPGAAIVDPGETVEDPLLLIRRDALTFVGDLDHGAAVAIGHGQWGGNMIAGVRRSIAAVALMGATVLVAGACGNDSGSGGNSVPATLKDFAIALDSSSVSSGEVTFSVKNDGPSVHEFVVFNTDLASDQLPTTEENGVPIVDEEGEGVTAVDEIEDIAVGSTQELKVTLQPGSYVVICNLPGHYEQGMNAQLTGTG